MHLSWIVGIFALFLPEVFADDCLPCHCRRKFETLMEGKQFVKTVNCSSQALKSVPETAIHANGDIYLFSENDHLILSPDSFRNMSKMQVLYMPENMENFMLNPLADNMQLKLIYFPSIFILNMTETFFNISRNPLLEIRNLHLMSIPTRLFYNTSNLKKLEVTTLQRESLAGDLLHACTFLKNLRLLANNITSLPKELLKSLRSLTDLTLEIDSVKYLPDGFLSSNTLLKHLVIVGRQLILTNTLISDEVISLNIHLIGMRLVSYSILAKSVRYSRVTLERVASLNCNLELKDDAVLNLTLFNSSLSAIEDGCLFRISRIDKVLNMSHNQISRLNPSSFPQEQMISAPLEVLDLSTNIIDNIDNEVNLPRNLRLLYLQENRIRALSPEVMSGLSSLETLRLDLNNMTTLHSHTFQSTVRLKYLNVSFNQLKYLPKDLFNQLIYLEVIDLQSNKLQVIVSEMFTGASLRLIGLRNNRITRFDGRFLNHPLQKEFCDAMDELNISLTGNDVYCECSLHFSFVCEKWKFEGSCYRPLPLYGRELSTLSTANICTSDGMNAFYTASKFVYNGTYLGALYGDSPVIEQVDLASLTHNGSFFISPPYILPTDELIVDTQDGQLSFHYNNESSMQIAVSDLQSPLRYADNTLQIALTDTLTIRVPLSSTTGVLSSDSIIIPGDSMNVSWIYPEGSLRMELTDSKTLNLRSGNNTFLQLDADSISVTSQGLTLSQDQDQSFMLQSDLPPTAINISDGLISMNSSDYTLSIISPSSTALYSSSDHTLNVSSSDGEVLLSIRDVDERIYINDDTVEYFGLNMSIEVKTERDVYINSTHTVIANANVKSVIATSPVQTTYWNGTHLLHGTIIIEADGLLILAENSSSIQGTGRDIILQQTAPTASWNTSHLVVNDSVDTVQSVFELAAIPVFSGGDLDFFSESRKLAVVKVGGAFPIFGADFISFGGNYSIQLMSNGVNFINDSHVIVKRATATSDTKLDQKSDEITGIYTAPGDSHFNSTHIVKKDTDNKTTAILSVPSDIDVPKSLPTDLMDEPTPTLLIRLYVKDGLTKIKFPPPIQMNTIPALPYFDGISILHVGTTKLSARGIPRVYNLTFVKILSMLPTYEIYLGDEISRIEHLSHNSTKFVNVAGKSSFTMATKGHLSISASSEVTVRDSNNQNLVMFYHTLLPKHISLEFDGLSSVIIADMIHINCVDNASISANQSTLALLTDVSAHCMDVIGVQLITFQDDKIQIQHSNQLEGIYRIQGTLVFSPASVRTESRIVRVKSTPSDSFLIVGNLQAIKGGLQYSRDGEQVAQYASNSPVLLRFKHLAEIGMSVSSSMISEMLYIDEALHINDGSNTWATVEGPLRFNITRTQVSIYLDGETQSIAHYQFSIDDQNYCKNPYSKFNNSADVLPFNSKAIYGSKAHILSEDVTFLPNSQQVNIGMLKLEVNISILLITHDHVSLGTSGSPLIIVEYEKPEFILSYDHLLIKDSKECIGLIADQLYHKQNPLNVKIVNSSLLSVEGARLQVLTDMWHKFAENSFDSNQQISVFDGATLGGYSLIEHDFLSVASHPIDEDYTGILINNTGIFVLKQESEQTQYVGAIICNGVPHFNGTAVVFYADGTMEAICFVDIDGYPNPVMEINSDSQLIYFHNTSRTAVMNITNMWSGNIHMNSTHLVYGIHGETLYAPGSVIVSAGGLIVNDGSNQSFEIANKQKNQRMVTVTITEDGVNLDYKHSDIDIRGEITNVTLADDGSVVITLLDQRDVIILTDKEKDLQMLSPRRLSGTDVNGEEVAFDSDPYMAHFYTAILKRETTASITSLSTRQPTTTQMGMHDTDLMTSSTSTLEPSTASAITIKSTMEHLSTSNRNTHTYTQNPEIVELETTPISSANETIDNLTYAEVDDTTVTVDDQTTSDLTTEVTDDIWWVTESSEIATDIDEIGGDENSTYASQSSFYPTTDEDILPSTLDMAMSASSAQDIKQQETTTSTEELVLTSIKSIVEENITEYNVTISTETYNYTEGPLNETDDGIYVDHGSNPSVGAVQGPMDPVLFPGGGKDRRLGVKMAYVALISIASFFVIGGVALFVWNRCYYGGETYSL